jgi:Tetraspanin family
MMFDVSQGGSDLEFIEMNASFLKFKFCNHEQRMFEFLVFLSFFFYRQLLGLLVVVFAVWMLTDPTFLVSMTQEEKHYYIALYIFLAVGALLLLVAFLGCCGAFKESQCMLVSVSSI